MPLTPGSGESLAPVQTQPVNVGVVANIILDQQYQTIVKDVFKSMSRIYNSVAARNAQLEAQARASKLPVDPISNMAQAIGIGSDVDKLHFFSIARKQVTVSGQDTFPKTEWEDRNKDFITVWNALYHTASANLDDFALPVGYFFKGGGESPRPVMLSMHRDSATTPWQASFLRTERNFDPQGGMALKTIDMGKEAAQEVPQIRFFKPFFDQSNQSLASYGTYFRQLQVYFRKS